MLLCTKRSQTINSNKVSILKTTVSAESIKSKNNLITIGDDLPRAHCNTSYSEKEIPQFCEIIGPPNPDSVSSYANTSLQTLLHCISIRTQLFKYPEQNILCTVLQEYLPNRPVNIMGLKVFAHI